MKSGRRCRGEESCGVEGQASAAAARCAPGGRGAGLRGGADRGGVRAGASATAVVRRPVCSRSGRLVGAPPRCPRSMQAQRARSASSWGSMRWSGLVQSSSSAAYRSRMSVALVPVRGNNQDLPVDPGTSWITVGSCVAVSARFGGAFTPSRVPAFGSGPAVPRPGFSPVLDAGSVLPSGATSGSPPVTGRGIGPPRPPASPAPVAGCSPRRSRRRCFRVRTRRIGSPLGSRGSACPCACTKRR